MSAVRCLCSSVFGLLAGKVREREIFRLNYFKTGRLAVPRKSQPLDHFRTVA